MDDLGGHGTEQMRAAGCACRWCELWQQISDARRAKKAAKIVTMADRSADPDGCWVWKHTLTPDGYGRVGWNGYSQLAHRVAFELLVGPIPDGLQIDHRCRNRACINPRHLQAVTSKQNNENRAAEGGGTSGLRNVYWVASRGYWMVSVGHNGRTVHGGYFRDIEQARRAAAELRARLFTNSLADLSN